MTRVPLGTLSFLTTHYRSSKDLGSSPAAGHTAALTAHHELQRLHHHKGSHEAPYALQEQLHPSPQMVQLFRERSLHCWPRREAGDVIACDLGGGLALVRAHCEKSLGLERR